MGLRRLLFRTIAAASSDFRCSITSSSSPSPSASIKFLSTIATQKTHLNLVVDYLINSFGFSKEAAISLSSKFKVTTHLRSPLHNFDSAVNLLKTYGFDDTQIKHLVSSYPTILRLDANKTLEPKLRALLELGVSRSDLAMYVTKNPSVLLLALNTRIIPIVDYLRDFLGSNENAFKSISKSKWFLANLDTIKSNVVWLRNYGLSDEQIRKILLSKPDVLTFKPERLGSSLKYMEEKWGIPRDSTTIVYALDVVLWSDEQAMENKVDVFRSFGWSDTEIYALLRSCPKCTSCTRDKIRDKLDFFVKELGYTPAYLSKCLSLLTLSLEKRVKPRNRVLKILVEKKLVEPGRISLYRLAKLPEPKFVEFVQRFKNGIPDLYETYIKTIRSREHPGGEQLT